METFFGTIIGGVIALFGVFVTLKANQRIFEAKLSEERERAKKEREFIAKHKALILALESVTRFVNYYITLPDRDLPKDGTIQHEVAEMSVALNGLHFYCGLETIQCSISMGQILGTSFTKALKAKMPAMFIAENIKVIDQQILGFETANSQLQQEILALLSSNLSSQLPISPRQHLADNLDKIGKLYSEKAILIKEKYKQTEACRDVIREDLKEVYGALRNVLLMARRELGFPINESQYLAILNQATELALDNLKSLFDEIRSEISKRLQEA